jgi:2,5-furandicarboxylate decarboxylase 1
MALSLRDWVSVLDEQAPEEIVHVSKTVHPARFESACVVDALERQRRFPAVLFESVTDLKERPTSFKIINNTFGNFRKIGLALGLDTSERVTIMDRILQRSTESLPVKKVTRAAAPVKSCVTAKKDVDLSTLPLIRHTDMDGGPYLTPIVVSKSSTGRYNISWNRMQYLDRNHLAIYMSPRHLWSYFAAAESKEESLPIAVVMGHHPSFHLTGAMLTPLDADEYEAVGGVMNEPLEVTPSETWGEDFLVPAQAEAILEARILTRKRCVEGPFGEYTGYTGAQRLSWVAEIEAMTMRENPIIIDIFPCKTEHINAHLPIEASIYQRAKQAVPGVVKTCWVGSGGPFNLIISLKKRTEGEPMRAAMAAMSAGNFIKHVIVVDDDIDPEDMHEVMWALSSRVQADQDLTILRNLQGQVLDPSLRHEIKSSGMIIDATKPMDRPFPRRGSVPEEVRRRINLEEYLEP